MPIVGGKTEYRTLTKTEKTELWLSYLAKTQVENERQATDKPLEDIDADDMRRELEKQQHG
jgi:hypothetical protein